MRIGLTYNLKPEGAEGDQFEEFDSLETIEGLERAVRAAGHEPVRLGWGAELLDALRRERVDAVVNIAEGVGGRGRESQVPALMEMLGIPCSGSAPLPIALTLDKALAKSVAKAAGIATAPWRIDSGEGLRAPLFAKPAGEGSSMGITAQSLCRDQAALDAALQRLARYGAVLVEEFLPGDEYTVGIVGGEILGVMQVVPRSDDPDFIYSLDVKRDYANRVEYRLVDAPDVAEVAMAVWRAFDLRDVARIDVRRDRDGVANFVEVNPLPGVHPVNSDLVIMARLAGVPYEELIHQGIPRFARNDKTSVIPSREDGEESPDSKQKTSPIAVAYNDDLHLKPHLSDAERVGEAEVIETAREIAAVLGADLVPVGDDVLGALDVLRQYDVVVNLCEGVRGRPEWEMHFGLALEMLGIRHTGGDPIAAGICTDKKLVKRILRTAGVSTPRFWHGETDGTWIVKPSREDAGIGIDGGSVVSGSEAIEARVRYINEKYSQPALVEEFIDGRELNQAIYFTAGGPVVLPPGEIVFDDSLPPRERVVGYAAKWDAGSAEDRATRNITPAVIDDTLRREVADLCLRAASVLSLRGYVRFDLRQSQTGQLWIVDINPNPDLGRDAGFRKALAAAGIAFEEFLRAAIMAARA